MLRYKLGYSFEKGMGHATLDGADIYHIDSKGVKFIGAETDPLFFVGQYAKVGELYIKRNASEADSYGNTKRTFLISELDPFFNADKIIHWRTDVKLYIKNEPIRKIFTEYIHNAIEGNIIGA